VPGEDRLSAPLFVAACPNCGLELDWRLRSGMDFLRGAILHWEPYLALDGAWDHDHCALCWQKFMEEDLPGVEQAGYVTCTTAQAWWICPQCFEDLREEMNWQVEPPDEGPF
jgi:hypothetical protein